MKRPTLSQFSAYQRIFDYFNRTLFAENLPGCMLSFSNRRTSSRTLFSSAKWHKDNGFSAPEISVNLKQLSRSRPKEVMAALVCQMVHLWQEAYGNPSQKGYYNREWATKMEEIGLIPTATGLPGGKPTGQTIKHYIEPGGRFEQAFNRMPPAYLWPFIPSVHAHEGSNGSKNKVLYQCPSCSTKVWGKGGLGLICECGTVFIDESGERKEGTALRVYQVLALQFNGHDAGWLLQKDEKPAETTDDSKFV